MMLADRTALNNRTDMKQNKNCKKATLLTTEKGETKEDGFRQSQVRHDEVIQLTSCCVDGTDDIHLHTIQQHDCHVSQKAFICTLNTTTLSYQFITNINVWLFQRPLAHIH